MNTLINCTYTLCMYMYHLYYTCTCIQKAEIHTSSIITVETTIYYTKVCKQYSTVLQHYTNCFIGGFSSVKKKFGYNYIHFLPCCLGDLLPAVCGSCGGHCRRGSGRGNTSCSQGTRHDTTHSLGLGLRMGMGLSSHGSCLHLALIPQLVVVRAALSEDAGVYLLISPLLSHTLVPRILTLELRAESRLLVRPEMMNHINVSQDHLVVIFLAMQVHIIWTIKGSCIQTFYRMLYSCHIIRIQDHLVVISQQYSFKCG